MMLVGTKLYELAGHLSQPFREALADRSEQGKSSGTAPMAT